MQRVRRQDHAEAIAHGLGLLPAGMRPLVEHAHFLVATDPVFAGLHPYDQAADGRSYRLTGHVTFRHQQPLHASRRATTVVLPLPEDLLPQVIVHELGHVLHERIGWEGDARPVTGYAQRNRWEAFAEAFTAWVLGPAAAAATGPHIWRTVYVAAHERLYQDRRIVDLFERLAAGTPAAGRRPRRTCDNR